MGIYDRFADAPSLIKIEGQEITLKVIKDTVAGTATLSWNIPAPAAGCAPGSSGAYDGIVITVSAEPADYIGTSPKDGKFYIGDPTVDQDLHSGDKLGKAQILAAFYNDRTHNTITVTDVKPRVAYYFSAYAVDNVGRYHREGVHSYSLPTGILELNKGKPDQAAYHDILIDVMGGINPNKVTGFDSLETYDFIININQIDYTITINGVDALTYNNLICAINKQFKLLENPLSFPTYPNINEYYFDLANKTLYQWNGLESVPQDVIVGELDPTIPILGTYWFDPDNNILREYETGGWAIRPFLSHNIDPTEIECGQLWYDGVNVWQWDGNHWCKLCLYVQTTNPILPPKLTCNTYWFDTANRVLYRYNDKLKKWDDAVAIMSLKDPNILNTGDFWYNETDGFVYRYVGSSWNLVNTIRYAERNEEGDLDNPVADIYWFIPSELTLFQRDSGNSTWTEIDIAVYPTDPRVRASCDLWWAGSASNYALYAWDEVNDVWSPVNTLFKTVTDPALAPELEECAVWLNPTTGDLKLISNTTCDDRPYINFPYDPTNPEVYSYWYDNANNIWYIWNGSEWEEFALIISTLDPFFVEVGTLWFDMINLELKRWDGSAWVEILYETSPLTPTIGTQWFNTVEDELYEWNGTGWVIAQALATLKFVKPDKPTPKSRDLLDFYTRELGCNASIEVKDESDNLFRLLVDNIIYLDPVEGNSGLDAGPSYKQLGVGDDGSPDERRKLHDSIRLQLGMLSVRVELTKEQIDEAIDNALLMLRKYSSLGSRRAFFFLNIKRNQQTYIMTNKCAGFNKITGINTLYRMKSAFFRTAFAGNDMFGIAALQQLYSIGSFNLLSFHLVSSYIEELDTLFANRIMFQWIEPTRELKLLQNFFSRESVLVDGTIERTEQDLLVDRETALWIKNYAIASAKLMLSQVRGKFQNLPGPNGSTALNTQDLISQAQSEMEKLEAELYDMGMQNLEEVGLRAHLILG